MTDRRIIDDELFSHFVTFGVDRRRRLLDLDPPKRILLAVLTEQLELQNARCAGFVVMPDHVHLLVWFPKTRQLSTFMHGLKRKSSFHLRRWYRENAPEYFNSFEEGRRFWSPKYYSFEVFSDQKMEEKIAYMHLNPVRAGLVTRAVEWRWSSARKYILNKTVGVPIEPPPT